jgi:hypothetical protein
MAWRRFKATLLLPLPPLLLLLLLLSPAGAHA